MSGACNHITSNDTYPGEIVIYSSRFLSCSEREREREREREILIAFIISSLVN